MTNKDKDITTKLHTKNRDFLSALLVSLWQGKPKFNIDRDSRTESKSKLVNFIAKNYPPAMIERSFAFIEGDHLPAEVNGETVDAGDILGSALSTIINKQMANVLTEGKMVEVIKDEIKKLPPYNIHITVNDQPVIQMNGYVRPEFHDSLERAAHRLNVMLVGPAGSGKTHIAKQVSDALGMRFGSISCSAGMSESHLTGWLLPLGEHGRFDYAPSVFVDIYENGGVFLFDEIDAADSNTLLFVNQALANGRFFLPQRHTNPEVVKHPDCIIMAAANTYGTGGSIAYAGRERLDESTLDRFRAGMVSVGYDKILEETLVEPDLLHWGRDVRDKIASANLSRVMSTRFLIDASKLKRSGVQLKKIQESYFHGWREDERRKVA